MRKLLLLLLLGLVLFVFGCGAMGALDSDFPIADERGITVVSCPNQSLLYVNDIECVTPCKISLPWDTDYIKVTYDDRTSNVAINRSSLHKYNLTGTLIVPSLSRVGTVTAGGPYAPYFIRDTSLGLSDLCD